MVEKHLDWTISSRAPVKWGRFNDYYVGASAPKYPATISILEMVEDIVSSLEKFRAVADSHRKSMVLCQT